MQNPLYNKPLHVEAIKRNAQLYNEKFKEECKGLKNNTSAIWNTWRSLLKKNRKDKNNVSIVVFSKELDPLESSCQDISESHKDFVVYLKDIQLKLKDNEYVGVIYSPFRQGHVTPLILSKNNVFLTAPHNDAYDFDKLEPDIFSEEREVVLNTVQFIKSIESTRAIQSDKFSCGVMALKTIKTLLSPVEDGRLLIETLPIRNGSIEMPPDILKISQSEVLVQEKIKNIPEEKRVLLTGKHRGMPLEEHRSRFTKYSDEGKPQSSYVDKLRERYVERANNTTGQISIL